MIYLSTITPKKVVLLSNRNQDPNNSSQDLSTNYYTFKITSCDSFQEYVFSPTNFTQSPYYDAFTVSVGTPQSMTGSVMLDVPSGQYNFEIYKMPTEYNLNIASASYTTEHGILQIIGSGSVYTNPQPTTFTQSDSDTIRVFTEL